MFALITDLIIYVTIVLNCKYKYYIYILNYKYE